MGDGNSGKTIIVHGDKDADATGMTVYFVNAALDGTVTDVTAADITIVANINAFDLDTLVAANFAFS